jgi:tripartite-type tricarboxylate transporter receptor subunit TctC
MALVGLIGGNPAVQFDPRKFTWLGSSSSYSDDAYVLIVRKDAPVKSIDEARRPGGPPMVIASTAEGASGNDVPVILRDLLGLNIRLIAGYRDSAAIFLAVDQKEADGRTVGLSAVRATHPQWLEPGNDMRILLQFARATRLPDMPDVPTARELAPNPSVRSLVELAELPYLLSRPFAAPPDIPKDRAAALEAAFLAAHRDPDYLADAAKLKVEVSPIGSAEIVQAIERISQTPPDVLRTMAKLLAQTGDKP